MQQSYILLLGIKGNRHKVLIRPKLHKMAVDLCVHTRLAVSHWSSEVEASYLAKDMHK